MKFSRPHNPRKCRQSGVALITALLIVSLATIMAVSLTAGQYMDVRRTGNIMASDQAYLQALTMETSAGHLLTFSRNDLGKKFDDKNEFEQAVLGLNANAMQVGENEAQVSLELVYPEAVFNVNTLLKKDGKLNTAQHDQFRRLFQSVLRDIEEPESSVDNLIAVLLDWIDEDEDERPGGAEDGVYESKETPYKTANRIMASISEMQLLEGYTKKILYGIPKDEKDESSEAIPGILHYVSALPDIDSTLNINLITEPRFIEALSSYITPTMAQEIIAAQPFEEVTKFKNHEAWDEIKSKPKDLQKLKEQVAAAKLDVQSSYFAAKSTAVMGNSVFILNSLVYVKTDGTKLEVVSRAIGTDGI